jgi:cation transport regulator ChaC
MSGMWVFDTLQRDLTLGHDFHEAEIAGYGRRWNYGVRAVTGETIEADGSSKEWTIVVLGLTESADETTNGVIGWVEPDEIEALDRRERNYNRVDVTELATLHHGVSVDGPIVTYVPRPEPLEKYEEARTAGVAAVEERYWNLVDRAFADLGADRHERYHSTTPAPDVPIVAMRRDKVPPRYQVGDNT